MASSSSERRLDIQSEIEDVPVGTILLCSALNPVRYNGQNQWHVIDGDKSVSSYWGPSWELSGVVFNAEKAGFPWSLS